MSDNYNKIIKQVPPVVTDSAIQKDIYDAQSESLDQLDADIIDTFNQLYVDTATWGLKYWEEFLGITTNLTKSYQDRRITVKDNLNRNKVVNKQFLRDIFINYGYSNDNIAIEENITPYIINVTIDELMKEDTIDEMIAFLQKAFPAHLNGEISFKDAETTLQYMIDRAVKNTTTTLDFYVNYVGSTYIQKDYMNKLLGTLTLEPKGTILDYQRVGQSITDIYNVEFEVEEGYKVEAPLINPFMYKENVDKLLTTGMHSCTDSMVRYIGTWTETNAFRNDGLIGKTSSTVGDYIEFSFVGTGFSIYGYSPSVQTTASISLYSVNGSRIGDNGISYVYNIYVNQDSLITSYGREVYTINNLYPGLYRIKISVVDKPLYIDSIEIRNNTDWGRFSISSNMATAPHKYDIPVPNGNDDVFNVGMLNTEKRGDFIEWTFEGTACEIRGLTGNCYGIAKITIDNKDIKTVDYYENKNPLLVTDNMNFYYDSYNVIFRAENLDKGVHIVRIEDIEVANSLSSSPRINVTSFAYEPYRARALHPSFYGNPAYDSNLESSRTPSILIKSPVKDYETSNEFTIVDPVNTMATNPLESFYSGVAFTNYNAAISQHNSITQNLSDSIVYNENNMILKGYKSVKVYGNTSKYFGKAILHADFVGNRGFSNRYFYGYGYESAPHFAYFSKDGELFRTKINYCLKKKNSKDVICISDRRFLVVNFLTGEVKFELIYKDLINLVTWSRTYYAGTTNEYTVNYGIYDIVEDSARSMDFIAISIDSGLGSINLIKYKNNSDAFTDVITLLNQKIITSDPFRDYQGNPNGRVSFTHGKKDMNGEYASKKAFIYNSSNKKAYIKTYDSNGEYVHAIDISNFNSNNPGCITTQFYDDDRIQESYPQLVYSGTGWSKTKSTLLDTGKGKSSSTANDIITLSITGDRFDLYGLKGPDCGIITLTIDSGAPVTIDCYAENFQSTLLYTAVGLKRDSLGEHFDSPNTNYTRLNKLATDVTHTMVITVTGTKNTNSTGTNFTMDYVFANEPRIPYTFINGDATKPAPDSYDVRYQSYIHGSLDGYLYMFENYNNGTKFIAQYDEDMYLLKRVLLVNMGLSNIVIFNEYTNCLDFYSTYSNYRFVELGSDLSYKRDVQIAQSMTESINTVDYDILCSGGQLFAYKYMSRGSDSQTKQRLDNSIIMAYDKDFIKQWEYIVSRKDGNVNHSMMTNNHSTLYFDNKEISQINTLNVFE